MPVLKKTVISFITISLTIFLIVGNLSAASEKTGVITGDVVNFRAYPNTSSKILSQLKKGARVSILGSEGDWFNVSYSDATGWISDKYIVVRDEKIAAGVVSGSVVNVRSKPSTSSEVLKKLTKGTIVEIFEHSGDWYRISIGEDRYGFIHSDYVSIREEPVSRGAVEADAAAAAAAPAGDAAHDLLLDAAADLRQKIVELSKQLLGVKYVYGGSTAKGFDCSGFVSYVFAKFGITLDRSSRDMGNGGIPVKKTDMEPGDLIFFDTNGGLNGINHVGIYIGDGKFIHASSSLGRKVTISNLGDSFYNKTYMRSRDYLSK